MSARRTLPFLVAVETDPLRYHGEHAVQPSPLAAGEAEQLLAHVAADLAKLFPAVSAHGLCGAGALYDQAQVLRPGWPLFAAMADVARRRWKKEDAVGGLLSIGTAGGHMPAAELAPDPALPPGILLLLPLQLHGDATALDRLEADMEHRFMEEGQLSPLTARAIENAFGVATTHARFITRTDLMAMLKLQLEHFGFAGLWTLLDAALESSPEPREVALDAGPRFAWDGTAVRACFEPFDHWATEGGGRELPPEALLEAYLAWTREYRRYRVTLDAHDVPVTAHLPGEETPLEGLFLAVDAGPAEPREPAITEHDGGDLGVLAVTVVHEGRLRHFYPLAPEGSNAIHRHLAEQGVAAGGVAYPGRPCLDAAARALAPDCDDAAT